MNFQHLMSRRMLVASLASGFALLGVVTGLVMALAWPQRSPELVCGIDSNASLDHLDSSFGVSGERAVALPDPAALIADVIVLKDNSFLVGAVFPAQPHRGFQIGKYSRDGAVDATFGTNGWTQMPVESLVDMMWGMQEGADGEIYVAVRTQRNVASSTNSSNRTIIAKYLSDGRVDSGFARGGWLEIESPLEGYEVGDTRHAITPLGELIIAAQLLSRSFDNRLVTSVGMVQVFSGTGMIDKGFGEHGSYVYIGGNGETTFSTVRLTADNEIVLSGTVSNGRNHDWLIFVLSRTGVPVERFGQHGAVTGGLDTDLVPSEDHGIAVQVVANNRLVVVATGQPGVQTRFTGSVSMLRQPQELVLYRLNTDGALDQSYGDGGVRRLSFAPCDATALVYAYSAIHDVLVLALNHHQECEQSSGCTGRRVVTNTQYTGLVRLSRQEGDIIDSGSGKSAAIVLPATGSAALGTWPATRSCGEGWCIRLVTFRWRLARSGGPQKNDLVLQSLH